MPRAELDPGLARVARVLAQLGHPERAFAAVHVAGTNGKGSVCALVESALRACGGGGEGLVVGRFTSPFLREPRDAVWVRGAPPTPDDWDAALQQVLAAERAAVAAAAADAASAAAAAAAALAVSASASASASSSSASAFSSSPSAGAADGASGGAAGAAAGAGGAIDHLGSLTTFELWTAASFVLFREARCDVAVIEVGVGGRDDATNVLPTPAVAIVASVSLDHVELLGPTLVDIARHKAGIIKPGPGVAGGGAARRPVAVMAPDHAEAAAAVIRARAAEVGAELVEARSLEWADEGDPEPGAAAGAEAGAAAAASPLMAAADALGRRPRLARERPSESGRPSQFPSPPPPLPPLLLRLGLPGRFQLANGGAALAALRVLQRDPSGRFAALTDAAIAAGFAAAAWPGRLEAVALRVGPAPEGLEGPEGPRSPDSAAPAVVRALLDGGHNEGALPFVREAVDELLAARTRGGGGCGGGDSGGVVGGATFIYACSASRPLATVLPLLLRAGDRLLAVPFSPPEGMAWVRPHAPAAVAAAARALLGDGAVDARACGSLGEALALVGAGELCVVCGSLYLVADVHRSGRVVAS
jgi:folylpolyglutamate synthase/dihydropteroate synthase